MLRRVTWAGGTGVILAPRRALDIRNIRAVLHTLGFMLTKWPSITLRAHAKGAARAHFLEALDAVVVCGLVVKNKSQSQAAESGPCNHSDMDSRPSTPEQLWVTVAARCLQSLFMDVRVLGIDLLCGLCAAAMGVASHDYPTRSHAAEAVAASKTYCNDYGSGSCGAAAQTEHTNEMAYDSERIAKLTALRNTTPHLSNAHAVADMLTSGSADLVQMLFGTPNAHEAVIIRAGRFLECIASAGKLTDGNIGTIWEIITVDYHGLAFSTVAMLTAAVLGGGSSAPLTLEEFDCKFRHLGADRPRLVVTRFALDLLHALRKAASVADADTGTETEASFAVARTNKIVCEQVGAHGCGIASRHVFTWLLRYTRQTQPLSRWRDVEFVRHAVHDAAVQDLVCMHGSSLDRHVGACVQAIATRSTDLECALASLVHWLPLMDTRQCPPVAQSGFKACSATEFLASQYELPHVAAAELARFAQHECRGTQVWQPTGTTGVCQRLRLRLRLLDLLFSEQLARRSDGSYVQLDPTLFMMVWDACHNLPCAGNFLQVFQHWLLASRVFVWDYTLDFDERGPAPGNSGGVTRRNLTPQAGLVDGSCLMEICLGPAMTRCLCASTEPNTMVHSNSIGTAKALLWVVFLWCNLKLSFARVASDVPRSSNSTAPQASGCQDGIVHFPNVRRVQDIHRSSVTFVDNPACINLLQDVGLNCQHQEIVAEVLGIMLDTLYAAHHHQCVAQLCAALERSVSINTATTTSISIKAKKRKLDTDLVAAQQTVLEDVYHSQGGWLAADKRAVAATSPSQWLMLLSTSFEIAPNGCFVEVTDTLITMAGACYKNGDCSVALKMLGLAARLPVAAIFDTDSTDSFQMSWKDLLPVQDLTRCIYSANAILINLGCGETRYAQKHSRTRKAPPANDFAHNVWTSGGWVRMSSVLQQQLSAENTAAWDPVQATLVARLVEVGAEMLPVLVQSRAADITHDSGLTIDAIAGIVGSRARFPNDALTEWPTVVSCGLRVWASCCSGKVAFERVQHHLKRICSESGWLRDHLSGESSSVVRQGVAALLAQMCRMDVSLNTNAARQPNGTHKIRNNCIAKNLDCSNELAASWIVDSLVCLLRDYRGGSGRAHLFWNELTDCLGAVLEIYCGVALPLRGYETDCTRGWTSELASICVSIVQQQPTSTRPLATCQKRLICVLGLMKRSGLNRLCPEASTPMIDALLEHLLLSATNKITDTGSTTITTFAEDTAGLGTTAGPTDSSTVVCEFLQHLCDQNTTAAALIVRALLRQRSGASWLQITTQEHQRELALSTASMSSHSGLVNHGLTCFASAVLQQLFHNKMMFASVVSMVEPTPDDHVRIELQTLLASMAFSRHRCCETAQLLQACGFAVHNNAGHDGVDACLGQQRSADEFLSWLTHMCHQSCGADIDGALTDVRGSPKTSANTSSSCACPRSKLVGKIKQSFKSEVRVLRMWCLRLTLLLRMIPVTCAHLDILPYARVFGCTCVSQCSESMLLSHGCYASV